MLDSMAHLSMLGLTKCIMKVSYAPFPYSDLPHQCLCCAHDDTTALWGLARRDVKSCWLAAMGFFVRYDCPHQSHCNQPVLALVSCYFSICKQGWHVSVVMHVVRSSSPAASACHGLLEDCQVYVNGYGTASQAPSNHEYPGFIAAVPGLVIDLAAAQLTCDRDQQHIRQQVRL